MTYYNSRENKIIFPEGEINTSTRGFSGVLHESVRHIAYVSNRFLVIISRDQKSSDRVIDLGHDYEKNPVVKIRTMPTHDLLVVQHHKISDKITRTTYSSNTGCYIQHTSLRDTFSFMNPISPDYMIIFPTKMDDPKHTFPTIKGIEIPPYILSMGTMLSPNVIVTYAYWENAFQFFDLLHPIADTKNWLVPNRKHPYVNPLSVKNHNFGVEGIPTFTVPDANQYLLASSAEFFCFTESSQIAEDSIFLV